MTSALTDIRPPLYIFSRLCAHSNSDVRPSSPLFPAHFFFCDCFSRSDWVDGDSLQRRWRPLRSQWQLRERQTHNARSWVWPLTPVGSCAPHIPPSTSGGDVRWHTVSLSQHASPANIWCFNVLTSWLIIKTLTYFALKCHVVLFRHLSHLFLWLWHVFLQ